jgi:hypothetical protein
MKVVYFIPLDDPRVRFIFTVTHHRVWVLLIVEDPTMTKMQNINKSAVPLLEFVSSYDIRLSVMFIYSHIRFNDLYLMEWLIFFWNEDINTQLIYHAVMYYCHWQLINWFVKRKYIQYSDLRLKEIWYLFSILKS